MSTPQELLDRLDSRHDELIRKLDELNAQIEAALQQFSQGRTAEAMSESQPEVTPRASSPMRRAA